MTVGDKLIKLSLPIGFVKSADKIEQITLFDLSGKMLMQQNYSAGKNEVKLSLQQFADGLYFMQVKSDRAVRTAKVVIQH